MSDSSNLGIQIRSLRDHATTLRKLARDEIDNEEGVKSLIRHADDLERQAKELEVKLISSH